MMQSGTAGSLGFLHFLRLRFAKPRYFERTLKGCSFAFHIFLLLEMLLLEGLPRNQHLTKSEFHKK